MSEISFLYGICIPCTSLGAALSCEHLPFWPTRRVNVGTVSFKRGEVLDVLQATTTNLA